MATSAGVRAERCRPATSSRPLYCFTIPVPSGKQSRVFRERSEVGEVRCFPAAGFWTAARFQPYLRIARLALASIAALAVMAAGPALSEPGTVDSSAPGMASGRPPMVAAAQRTIAPAVPAPVSGEMPPLGPAGFNPNLSLQVLPPA